ncbi:hypothetical protein [Desulfotruncus alcoholivorax]|uniref:hypothetical protein n=1 Tax=Desulfotruncus alcoholivorax TaxID=265477 RepID=UPI0004139D2E|nr:hypothetical protein [Desulfotruncus alcoholivorax]
MKRAFWRGMITGSVLGVLMSMMKKPQKKLKRQPYLRAMRQKNSRRATDRMIRGVSRTVSGIIGKK